MKTTNYVVVSMLNTLQKYSSKKLPQRIGYAITRNLEVLTAEYTAYDKQLKKLFESYSDKTLKDDEGKPVLTKNGIPVVEEDVREEFGGQISELLNIETDIELRHIDPDIFDYDDKGIYDALSARDTMILQSILCEKEAEGDGK